jgi:hypothetical protein
MLWRTSWISYYGTGRENMLLNGAMLDALLIRCRVFMSSFQMFFVIGENVVFWSVLSVLLGEQG